MLHKAAYLTITPTVACPDDTVTFTCTLPGSFIQWDITPLQGARFSISLLSNNDDATEGIPAFRGVRNDTSKDNVTATLTSLSEASIVEGFMVECIGASSREGPLPITVAGEWLMNENDRVWALPGFCETNNTVHAVYDVPGFCTGGKGRYPPLDPISPPPPPPLKCAFMY